MNTLLPGTDAATFDDPLAMLLACHERIRKQLATLARLERHLPGHGHDADARAAARAIMRYFDSAAVHHHEDEEASLLPRVLARAPEAREVSSRLVAEHRELAGRWRKLRPLLSGIASGQRAVLPPRLVHEITRAYESHIAIEEGTLIPLAQDVLPPDEIAAIGREMAARRGVAPPA
ncbi:MAG TPA: hemerythrin domain-containing protein [Casimicrobiaceae bacterium]|nr:hemerythrin domain-containing protein [Casimicrobiaceae bacterium]